MTNLLWNLKVEVTKIYHFWIKWQIFYWMRKASF